MKTHGQFRKAIVGGVGGAALIAGTTGGGNEAPPGLIESL
jgi:hypothetical protein